jgi:phospholipid-binding lipoprotein MlaA
MTARLAAAVLLLSSALTFPGRASAEDILEELPTTSDSAVSGNEAKPPVSGEEAPPPDPVVSAEEAKPPQEDEFAGFEDMSSSAGRSDGKSDVRDPLQGFNRAMFWFNDKAYFWALKPTARVYRFVVPKPVRVAVHKAFRNAAFPVRFTNNLLQAKWRGAGRESGRFLVNSTIGLGGLFDPARSWLEIEPSEEDFGQTLGRWGVGAGIPLTLPFLGPTNLRDAFGMGPDYFLNPLSYLDPHDPHVINRTRLWLKAGDVINGTSLDIGKYETVKKDALDPYTYLRDFHKQMREKKIEE